jgi:ornithine cyclodeaminase
VDHLLHSGLPVHLVTDLEAAARAADVICCATMATSPLVKGRWLKEGAHLNLIGSFRPSMMEADADCFRNCLVVVDTLDALAESGDLLEPLRRQAIKREEIIPLRHLVLDGAPITSMRRTVFKSVGYALADLAAAEWLYQRSAVR